MPQSSKEDSSERMRLQKYLAYKGLCSRREAEEWIRQGEVWVNGIPAEIGQSVNPEVDTVKCHSTVLRPAPLKRVPVALLMNKPRKVICSHSDPHHSETIFDLLPARYQKEKLFLAGRLDKDSEGLVILTNEGAFAQALTHPSFEVIKRYLVTLNRDFDPNHVKLLLKGVTDEGEHLYAVKVILADHTGVKAGRQLEVHLAQGRKREVRRLFEAIGYFVHRLKRTHIGHWSVKGLPSGAIKLIPQTEVQEWIDRLKKTIAPAVKKAKRIVE